MKTAVGAILLGAFCLGAVNAEAQDKQDRRDKPLRTDFYPKRLDPEERHESGFYGDLNYQFIIFEGLGSEIYDSGMMIMIEGGYYWEKNGIFMAVGAYITPWGNAFKNGLDAGPPIGTFNADLDIFMTGVLFRFGNGSWPGWHFGVSAGGGYCFLSEHIEATNGSINRTTDDSGITYRGGLFLERDLINSEELGILLGLTFDYYFTGIKDVNNDDINFWSLGIRIVFSLRPGVPKARDLPQDNE